MTTPTIRVLVCSLTVLLLTGISSAERRLPEERGMRRGPYVYPVVPGTPAWEALDSHDAMVAATTVPEEYIAQMRTPALVETVLSYPLFWDAFFYNNTQTGMDAVAEQSNVIAALYERADAGPVLLQRYRRMTVPPAALADDAAMRLVKSFTFVETLLAQERIRATLTSEERVTLLDEVVRVASEKVRQPDAFGSFSLERTALIAGRLLYADAGSGDPTLNEFLRDGTTLPGGSLTILFDHAAARTHRPLVRSDAILQVHDYYQYVKTPHGTKVTVIYREKDFSKAEKKAKNAAISALYPKATRESESTKRYNCHSYAWHKQSSSNPYWMQSPNDDLYWTDKSYVGITSASADKDIPKDVPNGAKVGYPESKDHSAIKVSKTEFISKWGDGPLMRHKPDYTPYGCKKGCSLIYYRLK